MCFFSHNLTVLPVLPNMTAIYYIFGFLFGKLGLSKSMSLFLVVAWIVYLPVSDCHLSLITLIEIVLHAE